MRERTETGYEVFPEGHYTFTVTEPATKGKSPKGKYYYIFKFKSVVNGRPKKYTEVMMTWMAGELLRALRCTEESKGVFDWDKEEIVGRSVVADIIHEPHFQKPDEVVARMRNIVPSDLGMQEQSPLPALEEPDDPGEPPMQTAVEHKEGIPF